MMEALSPANIGLLLFGIFFVLLLIGSPIMVALGVATMACFIVLDIDLSLMIERAFASLTAFPLMALPAFVLAGSLMEAAGVSRRLVHVAENIVGPTPGGLAISTTLSCVFFGAISGSGPATTAAVGMLMIPAMAKRGYNVGYAAAATATAGGIGIIIPPSIPFIMYGMASGASVSDLFLAGIVPGLMIGLLLMLYAIYHCKKHGEDQARIQAEVQILHDKGLFRVLKESFFALLSPVIILGCIYSGVASPTEAAVISVFYALIISLFVYRSIHRMDIWGIFVEAIRTYTPILFILAASTAFSRVLTLMQVPQTVSTFILEHFHSPVSILLVLNCFLLIVGMVMDTTPAILILTPILLPIIEAIGMDPIQFGVNF